MADRKTFWTATIVVVFVALAVLFLLSLRGMIPLTYKQADTVPVFLRFLDSPRDDMRGVKANGHFLEIGKRRALQILPGYKEVFYQMRPYRQIQYKPRNMTRAEIVDMCFAINGQDLENLRSQVVKGNAAPVWKGVIVDMNVQVFKATSFTYFVTGLGTQPIYIGQVELAKRLGMRDAEILTRIIPAQESWLSGIGQTAAQSSVNVPDVLLAWLNAGSR